MEYNEKKEVDAKILEKFKSATHDGWRCGCDHNKCKWFSDREFLGYQCDLFDEILAMGIFDYGEDRSRDDRLKRLSACIELEKIMDNGKTEDTKIKIEKHMPPMVNGVFMFTCSNGIYEGIPFDKIDRVRLDKISDNKCDSLLIFIAGKGISVAEIKGGDVARFFNEWAEHNSAK